jgi:hypothetical protein
VLEVLELSLDFGDLLLLLGLRGALSSRPVDFFLARTRASAGSQSEANRNGNPGYGTDL